MGSQKEPALLLTRGPKQVLKPPLIQKIERTINPTVESMGFELVRVLLIGSGNPTLQIMAEKPDGTITLDECGKLSQAISAVLDVENIMEDSRYYLEVGSPGIDRPLTRLKDFTTYKGQEAKVESDTLINNRKRFKGTLQGVKGQTVLLSTEEGAIEIPFASIERAKLVVPEETVQPKQQKKKFTPKKQ